MTTTTNQALNSSKQQCTHVFKRNGKNVKVGDRCSVRCVPKSGMHLCSKHFKTVVNTHVVTTTDTTKCTDLPMLKLAIKNGSPWHPDASMVIARNKQSDANFKMLKWALSHGCPIHPDTIHVLPPMTDSWKFVTSTLRNQNPCLKAEFQRVFDNF